MNFWSQWPTFSKRWRWSRVFWLIRGQHRQWSPRRQPLKMIMASQPPLTYPLLRPYFCGWYLSGVVGWLASSHEMTAIGFRCRRWNRSELYEWNCNLLDVDGGPFHKLCYNGILSLTNEIHLSQLKSVHQLTPGPKKTLNCCFKIQSFAIDFWWGPKQRIQFHFEWFPLWF